MDWFTSDLHMDHKGMFNHRPRFSTLEEMNETILNAFNIVHRGDRVFLLGDIAWKKENLIKLFDLLLIKKRAIVYWIEGNHDHEFFKKDYDYKNLHKCQSIYIRGYANYQPIFMSHYPQLLWEKSYYDSFQLHGHGHEDTSDRPMLDNIVFGKRLNVNIELHDYKLWSRDEIEVYMSSRPKNMDMYLTHGNENQKKVIINYLETVKRLTDRMYDDIRGI